MRIHLVLVAGVLLLPAMAAAYPISPRTLPSQIDGSERVVLARVKSEGREEGLAVLEVRETWKGKAEAQVVVAYESGLICPAPPRFIQGQSVVAFLEMRDGRWEAVGLSYGTLYPEERDIPVVREAIRSYLALPRDDAKAHTEWLVGLASRRATRWDGLYELVPGADRLHAYYDHEGTRVPTSPLTAAHLQRIADGFVREPTGDQTFTMTLKLLEGFGHPGFDRVSLAMVDAFLTKVELPWWFPDAYALVLRRLAPAATPPEHSAFSPASQDVYRASWKQVRAQFHLPEVPPMELPGNGQSGVGSRTPS